MKRIERSIVETIRLFDKNDWEMCPYTVKMIKDSDKIKGFYRYYEDIRKEKLDKIVNFFWEKYEIGTFGLFWNHSKEHGIYGFYGGLGKYNSYRCITMDNTFIDNTLNFEPISEIPKYEGEK